jgi:hypothetical protein
MSSKRFAVFCVVAVLLVAAGCGAIGLERPQPMTARIVMTETGGIAGIANTLTIEPGLDVTYQSRQGVRTARLTSGEMKDLVALFYDRSFFSLKDDYRPRQPIADGITTSIAYSDAKRSKTVITGTSAQDPDSLQAILRELKLIVGETR